jgi:hypothetical protein
MRDSSAVGLRRLLLMVEETGPLRNARNAVKNWASKTTESIPSVEQRSPNGDVTEPSRFRSSVVGEICRWAESEEAGGRFALPGGDRNSRKWVVLRRPRIRLELSAARGRSLPTRFNRYLARRPRREIGEI